MAGGEGPGGQRARFSRCVSATPPSLSVSNVTFCVPRVPTSFPAQAGPPWPSAAPSGPLGVHCRLWAPAEGSLGAGGSAHGRVGPPRPATCLPPPRRACTALSGSSLTSLLSANTAVSWLQGLCTPPPRPGKPPSREARPGVGQSFSPQASGSSPSPPAGRGERSSLGVSVPAFSLGPGTQEVL